MDSTNNRDFFDNEQVNEASCVTIGIASPERIRSWSKGEVKNPETINYRTYKPEKGGLFCERIFGPTHDWECACGKYKRIKYKGVVCDHCGVEVTQARVRRERMGHLELAVPVSHVWFFKCLPSRLCIMLELKPSVLEKVLYYEEWIVIDRGNTPLQELQTLTDEEYQQAREEYGESTFKAGMGAEAIEQLLGKINLHELRQQLQDELDSSTDSSSKLNRKKIVKRLRLVEGFIEHDMDPRWMILHVLPVIPPELRPLVPLEGGRFATSDLNDLYRRVINRNTRLKNILQFGTPEVILRNEKRMLQESVDALMDNGRHGRAVTGTGNRTLKSLTDMLKGKQGRFRQNLLGKRVDYSGRSVIVVGPELRINQCGLPKEMALTLFEPFILQKLRKRGYVHTVRNAKKWLEQRRKEVWDILDEVIKGHPILLNRAPTLHRLSIQAFDPILIEGQAIRLHPLVCTAFNADFDGDQMAVHVPLSNEAQLEAKLLMLSPNNIFSPANGKPITTPSQDITLGAYYLCYNDTRKLNAFEATPVQERRCYNDLAEVLMAKQNGVIAMHDFFYLRNPHYGEDVIWNNDKKDNRVIVTTCGRCIFNEIWPPRMGFWNAPAGKKELGRMIKDCYENIGRSELIKVLDRLKDIGYEYATWAGFSIGIQDMIVPSEKKKIIGEAQKKIEAIRKERNNGQISEQERYNKSIDVWENANKDLADKLVTVLKENLGREEINPVYAMLDSGARGSKDQIRQLAGMRGLMAKPSGQIIENPILANFREGLTVLEYYISSHGARKGLADTALKTAESGYMTRRLVDVAHDVICVEDDCGTSNGTWLEDKEHLAERATGRFSADDIYDPNTMDLLVEAGGEITAECAKKIVEAGITKVHIRSVLTCESEHGICAKCYGRNLATGEMPLVGDPLGIIAAQSIGEPGTQLTMRTFHFGGTASAGENKTFYEAQNEGIIRLHDVTPIKTKDDKYVVIGKGGHVIIEDENENLLEDYELPAGSVLTKNSGEKVDKGERFVSWDAYSIPIITKTSGIVAYNDLLEGVTFETELSGQSGSEELIVMEHRQDIHPRIDIIEEGAAKQKSKASSKSSKSRSRKAKAAEAEEDAAEAMTLGSHALPSGAHIIVKNGQSVFAGDTLAKIPRQGKMTTDITGGLPRVAELFEARRPKRAAEISRLNGLVTDVKESGKGSAVITVTDLESGESEEHKIPAGKQIIVSVDDPVNKGQALTDGDIVLADMLEVCGQQIMQQHLVDSVQSVYRTQGVEINDKHIEIIVRQMMRHVRITKAGNTRFLFGEVVDKRDFERENNRVIAEGGEVASSDPVILGITKAALATDSFISAASFQDTTRILTEAATLGRVDYLRGFKENVIMGHLIPAGTGFHTVQDVIVENGPDVESKEDFYSEQTRKEAEEKSDMAELKDFAKL